MAPAVVGVVGCGWWATYAHLPALAANPDAVIGALADTNSERAAAAAEGFDVDVALSSLEQMLDAVELDAVIVAAPHADHYALARLAIERSKHVLVEKPMVLVPAHGRDLVSLAAEHHVELLVGYPWHYNAHALVLRDLLHAGRIGAIEHVSCLFASTMRDLFVGDPPSFRKAFPELFRGQSGHPVPMPNKETWSDVSVAGGGQGHAQVTHALALLFWLTGLTCDRVSAFTEDFELSVDLCNAVTMHFTEEATAVLGSIGSVVPGQAEILEYRVFGHDGHLCFDVNNGTASIHTRTNSEHLSEVPPHERYPHWAPANNLVDLALGRGVNGSPPDVGLQTVECIDAMYRSAATGRVVEMPRGS